MEALRFPIGRHRTVERFDRAEVERGIDALAAFPEEFRARLAGLGDRDLEKRSGSPKSGDAAKIEPALKGSLRSDPPVPGPD